jgi:hypothetical protein
MQQAMKLRVRHNSIRFRLGPSEVEALSISGACRETIVFPGQTRLEYALVASGNGKLGASFSGGVVSVSIPKSELADWHSSDRIGIRGTVDVAPGTTLSVLIEKDFRCLDERPDEDQIDTFANPLGAPQSCG